MITKQQEKKIKNFIHRIEETTNPKTQWVTDIIIEDKERGFHLELGRLYIENIRLEDEDTLVIMYYNRMYRIKVTEDTILEVIKLQ